MGLKGQQPGRQTFPLVSLQFHKKLILGIAVILGSVWGFFFFPAAKRKAKACAIHILVSCQKQNILAQVLFCFHEIFLKTLVFLFLPEFLGVVRFPFHAAQEKSLCISRAASSHGPGKQTFSTTSTPQSCSWHKVSRVRQTHKTLSINKEHLPRNLRRERRIWSSLVYPHQCISIRLICSD